MPDLLEQRDRPFKVTQSVLIEGVLKAGARLQRHLAAARQPSGLFVRHCARQTSRHMSNCHRHTQLRSRSFLA